jgi:hypothetical protein
VAQEINMFHKHARHDVVNLAGQVVNIDSRPFYTFGPDGNLVYHEPTKAEVLSFAIEEDRAHRLAKARAAAFGEAA